MITDKHGRTPNYVVIDDPEGNAILLHQPTGWTEMVGPRPYAVSDLRDALAALIKRVKA